MGFACAGSRKRRRHWFGGFMADYFGIAGLLLILVGWVVELWNVVKRKKAQVPLSFALLYGAGSALLTLHSMALGDAVFVALNASATLIALVNIAFNLVHGKTRGKHKA